MKCLLCPVEIDELKAFPAIMGPQGPLEDVVGKWHHSEALGKWTHVALTAQKGGGSMSILSGHICPAHPVEPGSIALAVSSVTVLKVKQEVAKVLIPEATPKGKEPK